MSDCNYLLLVREPGGESVVLYSPHAIYIGNCLAAYCGGNIAPIERCVFCSDEMLSFLKEGANVYPVEQIYTPYMKEEEHNV